MHKEPVLFGRHLKATPRLQTRFPSNSQSLEMEDAASSGSGSSDGHGLSLSFQTQQEEGQLLIPGWTFRATLVVPWGSQFFPLT